MAVVAPEAAEDALERLPRFRNRLMFPILDTTGNTTGFGGRLLGPGEPKYLNSPENAIFHKGRDSHDYKYGAAAWEECVLASDPAWRAPLAAAVLVSAVGSGVTLRRFLKV